MKIPKSFKLFSNTITVEDDESLVYRTGNKGWADYRDNKILLQSDCPGRPVLEKSKLKTFMHERNHHIFTAMGEHELANNEKFINLLTELQLQSEETLEY